MENTFDIGHIWKVLCRDRSGGKIWTFDWKL